MSNSTPLRLQANVPAAAGTRWLRDGWRAFAKRPLGFCGLFVAFLVAAVIALMIPVIGPLLLLASMPLLTLGFMVATRETLEGRSPTPALLLAPLRASPANRRALLVIGGSYALLTALVLWLSQQVDGGTFERLQVLMGSSTRDAAELDALLDDPRLSTGMLVRFGLAALLSIPYWHAPALVHWGGQGAAQAMFSSTLAIVRTFGAFSVYIVAWGLLVLGSCIACGVLLGALGAPERMAGVALPAGLGFSTVFYASLYFTFTGSFTEAEG